MLRHTIKQIVRSLWLHKRFTLIKLLGLAIGIAALIVIFLIAHYERSFDQFHSDSEHLYRVVSKTERADKLAHSATVPYPTGQFLREEYPGIEATQVHFSGDMGVRLGADASFKGMDSPFKEKNIVFADSLFFQVLDFGGIDDFWISGNPATALNKPGQAVLTEKTAQRYFGKANPMGRLIRLDNKVDVEVVGVVKDAPPTNHLPFNMIVSYATLNSDLLAGLDINNWNFTATGFTYVRLKEGRSPAETEAALQAIIQRHTDSELAKKSNMHLQPVTNIHFEQSYQDDNHTYSVSPKYLNMLVWLGIFIILIACVNYINLATAFAFTKSKEVGIRKTIGASRGQLLFHYMLETFTLTFCAAVLGLVLAVLVLPYINQILDKSIIITPLTSVSFIAAALGTILLITFISGVYPAIVLADFNTISSLKNQVVVQGRSSVVLRKALVVFQFTTSIALIIATLVIARQMEYFHQKELGFNKEAVVEVALPLTDSVKRENFRNLLQHEAGIQSLSFCLGAPISDNAVGVELQIPGQATNQGYYTRVIPCDKGYQETYQMELLAGRWFLPSEEQNIGSAVVVNQSLINTLGYSNPEEAIGKQIQLSINSMRPTIIGVMEDFHISSLHEDIEAVALTPFPPLYHAAGIRVNAGNLKSTLAAIEAAWKQVYPESIYAMAFIDDTLAARYQEETKNYELFKVFSVVSVFICCIGLWGLITFVVVRKTKEIGVRKVLGASVSGIVFLISKDFLKLVGLGLLIASPIAWYLMQQWLQDFAYRIDIGWWVFAVAGMIAILIAFLTISYQAIKAAMANPVKNLRTE